MSGLTPGHMHARIDRCPSNRIVSDPIKLQRNLNICGVLQKLKGSPLAESFCICKKVLLLVPVVLPPKYEGILNDLNGATAIRDFPDVKCSQGVCN
jgi:hypothetical protein